MNVKTTTHYRGEILQDLPRERLIEIIHDLVWESERRRQLLGSARKELTSARKELTDVISKLEQP